MQKKKMKIKKMTEKEQADIIKKEKQWLDAYLEASSTQLSLPLSAFDSKIVREARDKELLLWFQGFEYETGINHAKRIKEARDFFSGLSESDLLEIFDGLKGRWEKDE